MATTSAIYEMAARLRAECDAEYQIYQENYSAALEHETHGQVLRPESRAQGVRVWDLLTHNAQYVRAHATEEARDFMTKNNHLSARAYEREWLAHYPDPIVRRVLHGEKETMTEITIKIDWDLDEDDFSSFNEMAGYGVTYWAESLSDHDREATLRDHPGAAAVKDPDSGKVITWTIRDVPKMLAAVIEHDTSGSWHLAGYARQALLEHDMGHVDSELADVAIQLWGFGKLVYG